VDSIKSVFTPTPAWGLEGIRLISVSCGSRHTLALSDQVWRGEERPFP
jgi:hypothetical protein